MEWTVAIGVDTHKEVHVAVALDALGAELDSREFATTPAGYRLRVEADRLDAARFERLLAEGRGELEAGRADAAAVALEEALGLENDARDAAQRSDRNALLKQAIALKEEARDLIVQ